MESKGSPVSLTRPDPNSRARLAVSCGGRLQAPHRDLFDARATNRPLSSPDLAEFLGQQVWLALLGPYFVLFFSQSLSRYKLNLSSWEFLSLFLISLTTSRQQTVARRQGMKSVCQYQLSAGRVSLQSISRISSASANHRALAAGELRERPYFFLNKGGQQHPCSVGNRPATPLITPSDAGGYKDVSNNAAEKQRLRDITPGTCQLPPICCSQREPCCSEASPTLSGARYPEAL